MATQTATLSADRLTRRGEGGDGRRPLRMLISSAGRRVALLRSFRSSAAELGIDLEVFACDLNPGWSSACMEADHAFAVPPVSAPDYAEGLLSFAGQKGVTLIVPTIDTELLALAEARDRFAAAGITVAIGSSALVEIARDKLLTARFLEQADVPTPRTDLPEAALASPDSWRWPLIAKPRHGSCSRGIGTVADVDELRRMDMPEPYIVQERLVGREFTVNLYFDASGTLRCAVPHERLQVRGGEVEKGQTLRHPEFTVLAERLADAMDRPFGAMCFQAILSATGDISVFEINARFGGGYPLAHAAGATFARWLIEHATGRPSTASDAWRSGTMMLRYDDAVFMG